MEEEPIYPELGYITIDGKEYFVEVRKIPEWMRKGRLKKYRWIIQEHLNITELGRRKAKRWFRVRKPKIRKLGFGIFI